MLPGDGRSREDPHKRMRANSSMQVFRNIAGGSEARGRAAATAAPVVRHLPEMDYYSIPDVTCHDSGDPRRPKKR